MLKKLISKNLLLNRPIYTKKILFIRKNITRLVQTSFKIII